MVSGILYEQVERARDRERFPPIGRPVDIGGRTLNIYCSGAGQPAVILESGATWPFYNNPRAMYENGAPRPGSASARPKHATWPEGWGSLHSHLVSHEPGEHPIVRRRGFQIDDLLHAIVEQYVVPRAVFVDAAGQNPFRTGLGFSRWGALASLACLCGQTRAPRIKIQAFSESATIQSLRMTGACADTGTRIACPTV